MAPLPKKHRCYVPGERVEPSDLNPKNKLERLVWRKATYLAGRGVPQCNKDALLKLSAHGFDLLLLSYCGWQRDQEVRAAAKALG